MEPMWSHQVPSWPMAPWCSSVQWSLVTLRAVLPSLVPSPSAIVLSATSLKSGQGQWKQTNALRQLKGNICSCTTQEVQVETNACLRNQGLDQTFTLLHDLDVKKWMKVFYNRLWSNYPVYTVNCGYNVCVIWEQFSVLYNMRVVCYKAFI